MILKEGKMTRNRTRKRDRGEELNEAREIEEEKRESLIVIKFAEKDPTTPLIRPQYVTPAQMHAAAAVMRLIADQELLQRWQRAAMGQAREEAKQQRLIQAVSGDILKAQ
jgi:hypothetical protein